MPRQKHGMPGIYNAAGITLADGEGSALAVDSSGKIITTIATGDIEIGAVEIKNGTDDTRLTVLADNAAGTTPNVAVIGSQYQSSAQVYTSGDIAVLQSDVNGNLKITGGVASGAAAPTTTQVVGGVYNTSAPTYTAGQATQNQSDAAGNLKVSLATVLAAAIDSITSYPFGHSFLDIAAGQATTVVKSGPGVLHSITLNSAATATNVTTVYDNTAGSGTVIAIPAATTATVPVTLTYDIAFSTGLTIVTATANGSNMTVSYR